MPYKDPEVARARKREYLKNLTPEQREQRRQVSRMYYQRNKEQRREYNRTYAKAFRERHRERLRLKEQERRRRPEVVEARRAYGQKWRAQNPDALRQWRQKNAAHCARYNKLYSKLHAEARSRTVLKRYHEELASSLEKSMFASSGFISLPENLSYEDTSVSGLSPLEILMLKEEASV